MPRSSQYPQCGRCLARHKAGKEVTKRRVALTRKRWKGGWEKVFLVEKGGKKKMGEGERKLLGNCGKREEERKGKREKRGKRVKRMRKKEREREREREKERKGGEREEKGGKERSERPPAHLKLAKHEVSCEDLSTCNGSPELSGNTPRNTQKHSTQFSPLS